MTINLGTVSAVISARFGLTGDLADSTLGIMSCVFSTVCPVFCWDLKTGGDPSSSGETLENPFWEDRFFKTFLLTGILESCPNGGERVFSDEVKDRCLDRYGLFCPH